MNRAHPVPINSLISWAGIGAGLVLDNPQSSKKVVGPGIGFHQLFMLLRKDAYLDLVRAISSLAGLSYNQFKILG